MKFFISIEKNLTLPDRGDDVENSD